MREIHAFGGSYPNIADVVILLVHWLRHQILKQHSKPKEILQDEYGEQKKHIFDCCDFVFYHHDCFGYRHF